MREVCVTGASISTVAVSSVPGLIAVRAALGVAAMTTTPGAMALAFRLFTVESLSQVGEWFEERIFAPLRGAENTENVAAAVEAMCRDTVDYFVSRESVCLFAAMTLGQERETFAEVVGGYFTAWVDALAGALRRGGLSDEESTGRALDAVAAIQGGLILARAYGDAATFERIVDRTRQHLRAPVS
ncbi:hypothetical protein [Rhodococcoides kroppenstedtii]|uniref:LmrA/YxaF family transcription factor n=1 Tax=Rhodococcoides kroppenstedtii TaxID=293050 RepID=UPI0028ED99C8|nr:hypothetical protein [Rhodococcus kroppenstedtii]